MLPPKFSSIKRSFSFCWISPDFCGGSALLFSYLVGWQDERRFIDFNGRMWFIIVILGLPPMPPSSFQVSILTLDSGTKTNHTKTYKNNKPSFHIRFQKNLKPRIFFENAPTEPKTPALQEGFGTEAHFAWSREWSWKRWRSRRHNSTLKTTTGVVVRWGVLLEVAAIGGAILSKTSRSWRF